MASADQPTDKTLAATRTHVARRVARLPAWVGGLLGVTCLGVGTVLLLRPFASLGVMVIALAVALVVTGLVELAAIERHLARSRIIIGAVVGFGWVVAGISVMTLPTLTLIALMLIIAIGLIVHGVVRIIGAIRSTFVGRWAEILLGAAGICLGLIALLWPDVTVLVMAALFGVQLAVLGVVILAAVVRRFRPGNGRRPAARRRGGGRTALAAVAMVVAVALLVLSIRLTNVPEPDGFYAAPEPVPSVPGALLRAEPFTSSQIPDTAVAWRILYTTTRDEGVPAVASALVVKPADGGEFPVVAWAHGTTGFAQRCAPSMLEQPFVAGAMPNLALTLNHGWAVVATDYVGLGTEGPHPYLIGQGEGRSVLDAVRAAQELDGIGTQTVLWGHSQGGHAALWAGGLAHDYAPELDIAGVAALAPPANLPALVIELADSVLGPVFGAFVIAAYSAEYPEIDMAAYVRPGARVSVDEMSRRCLSDPSTIVSVAVAVFGRAPIWHQDLAQGALMERARQNIPTLPIEAPLLIAQGEADDLVLPATQQGYVTERCAEGQSIDYRSYLGVGHVDLTADASPLLPELFAWTADRFAGTPAAAGCVID